MDGRSASSFLASCGTMVAISPLVIWSNDSFFSLCRVRRSSMEPTLFPGDILVVRKADGFWQRWKLPAIMGGTIGDERQTDDDERSIERERVLAYEREHCNSNGSVGLLRKPPTPLTGDIVVLKDPEKYPGQWIVERVVAIGGETVRDDEGLLGKKGTKLGSTVYVPPYCIWVEGDNPSASVESHSRGHGPVSKKLLVGIAEYRLWPPWRIGKLDNENIPKSVMSNDKK